MIKFDRKITHHFSEIFLSLFLTRFLIYKIKFHNFTYKTKSSTTDQPLVIEFQNTR